MDKNEFNAWLSKNVGKGGQRSSLDGFNKHMKGHERNPRAPEYPCMDVEEYHHYKERYDFRKEDDDKKKQNDFQQDQNDKSQNSQASQGAGRVAQSVARNIIPKVALTVVGSVVIVVGYNEIKAKETQAAAVSSVWVWSDDNSTATLQFLNKDGKVVKEVPSAITIGGTDATCTKEGEKTYSASAQNEGKTYNDVHTVTLPALGHAFDEGTKTFIEGLPSIIYNCTRCGEIFIVTVSPEEIDPTIPDYSARWIWSEDHSTCEVEFSTEEGEVVKQVPAEVTSKTVNPTCVNEGAIIYKASCLEGWYTYTDTQVEVLPALGHTFGEGVESIVDGKQTISYECTVCHVVITMMVDVKEDEGENEAAFAEIYHHSVLESAHHDDECHHCEHHHAH